MQKRTSLPLTFLALLVLLSVLWLPASADTPTMPGFTTDKAAWQFDYEEALKAIPDPVTAKELSVALTSHSTLVGSDEDWQNVGISVEWLKSQGLDPEVVTYYPYISTLNEITLEIVEPTYEKLGTKENQWPWQENFDGIVSAYNAYSPAGDVTGDVVYVNYGVPEDYARLAKMGISVEGKIAIARYGISFRGVKTKVAAEHGAIGLLIYSDPADDGFVRGLSPTMAFPAYPDYPYGVYPEGPWRAPDGVQRGSILYIFEYVGDPLTPGWAATEKAPRLDPSRAESLPRGVPTTAFGYGEAAKLLSQLDGPEAPAAWQGGLRNPKWADFGITEPFTYHMGGTGKVKARMKLDIDYSIKPMWNIITTIPGKVHPEQAVVVGAHRDGWAYGTSDSTSGYIVTMEIARALKQLMDQGWQPDRSIILAGWDGEEYGLLGSTEWVEEFAQQLGKDCVGYINLDSAGGGQYFSASAVPSLDQLVYDVAKRVEEPRTPGKSVYEDWYARAGNKVPNIGRMGGGSDYQSFLQYVGVPSISMGFGGTGGGNYHSTTDDLYYMDHWGDPGYKHYAAMARLAGITALRLANADILPFVYSKYAGQVVGYLDQLEAKYPQYDLNFDREKAQAEAWQAAALKMEGQINAVLTAGNSIPPELQGKVDFINAKLITMERNLTQAKGVPGRTWYKHMIYTPGLYTGYAVQYLAPLEESITYEEWAKVNNYKALLHNSLSRATNTANTAAKAK